LESVDFAVSYVFAEHRKFVLEHIRHVRGHAPSWLARQFIVAFAALVFVAKKLRMPRCELHIDAAGIRRTTASGALNVPWSEVTAIHRYSPGYLIQVSGGALPIPYRCLNGDQRGRLDQLVLFRQGQLGTLMPFSPITRIKAQRLTIRPVTVDDLSDLLEINGDDQVTKFLPYATWRSLEDGAAWLARMQALCASGTNQQLVIERDSDHKVIGTILLFKFDESSARLELGYVLGRRHWRQGYAREALHAVCDHAFRLLLIRRIEAEVNPDNAASHALLQTLGFVKEGLLRKRCVAKGAAYDMNIYGCLAEEWPSARNAA
jgi:RimJ/RimL family protein N-acetyltransferase